MKLFLQFHACTTNFINLNCFFNHSSIIVTGLKIAISNKSFYIILSALIKASIMTSLHKNNIQVLMIMSYFIIRIVEGVHLLAVSIVDKPQIFMLATYF